MTLDTRSTPLSATLPTAIDGYDFDAETARAKTQIPEVSIAGHSLCRTTAKVRVGAEPAEWERAREAHRAAQREDGMDRC